MISKLEARAATQDLVIQSLVSEVNRQLQYNPSAVSAAYLLCHSLSISSTGIDGDTSGATTLATGLDPFF